MIVLQAITSLNPAGGGVAGAACLLHRDLASLGHHMELVCIDDPSATWLKDCPQPCHAVGPGRTGFQYSTRLASWLREHVSLFDAVIVHGLWQHIGLAVRAACLAAGVPYFVFPHGMLDPWFKHTFPLKHLKKWLYWPWGEYRVLRDAAAVLFTCEEERRLARQSFWLYRCREKVVGLGVEEPPLDSAGQVEAFSARFPALRGRRFLLFLGRLHPKKGIEILLGAFGELASNYAEVDLVIAGTPSGSGIKESYLTHLEGCAKKHCPSGRVHFVGLLQGEAKWGALRSAEAFVLPSHQENFGIAVVEALACSTPVLISQQVNIWREIAEFKAGMTDKDTLQGTIRVLNAWLGLPPTARQAFRAQAKECYSRLFKIRHVSDAILASIDETN